MVSCLKSPGRRVATALSFLILLDLCIPNVVSASSYHEADGAIQQAEQAISSAFEAVLEAEGAGANVSGLIRELNEAAGLLADAKISLNNGDLSDVVQLASRVVETADSVKDEASSLRASALSLREFVFKASFVGSGVGVSAFLLFMFYLWRWFKGYYTRKVLGLKPEVADDADA